MTAGLSNALDTDGFGSSVLGALVISVVTTVLQLVLRPSAVSRVGSSAGGEALPGGRR